MVLTRSGDCSPTLNGSRGQLHASGDAALADIVFCWLEEYVVDLVVAYVVVAGHHVLAFPLAPLVDVAASVRDQQSLVEGQVELNRVAVSVGAAWGDVLLVIVLLFDKH